MSKGNMANRVERLKNQVSARALTETPMASDSRIALCELKAVEPNNEVYST